MAVSGGKDMEDSSIGTQDSFEINCDPCHEVEGIFLKPEGFCNTCNEFMCSSCLKTHGLRRKTRNHEVLRGDDMPSSRPPEPTDRIVDFNQAEEYTDICKKHSGQIIRYFCKCHRCVGCMDCIALEHTSCGPKIALITDVISEESTEQEFKRFSEKLEQLSIKFTDSVKKAEEHVKDAEKLYKKANDDASQFSEEMINKIRSLKTEVEESTREIKTKDCNMMQRLINQSNSLLHETKQIATEFESLKKCRRRAQKFIFMKRMHSRLEELETNDIPIDDDNCISSYRFCPEERIKDTLKCAKQLGKIVLGLKSIENHEACQVPRQVDENNGQNEETGTLPKSEEKIQKDEAERKLKRTIGQELLIREINYPISSRLDAIQVMEMNAICDKYHVKVNVTKNSIELTGLTLNVFDASEKLHELMRNAMIMESNAEKASLIKNLVQWYFIEVTDTRQTLEKYEANVNYMIETAFKKQERKVSFLNAKKNMCEIDFSKMEEYPVDEPHDVVSVIRRDLLEGRSFESPSSWTEMKGNLVVVQLGLTDIEYIDIKQKFLNSTQSAFTVIRVDRIQNKTLWQQYQAKKKQLESQNPQGTTNERLLWHGTYVNAIDSINANGFNRSLCGRNGNAFGDGACFAVSAAFASSNTYSRPEPGTNIKRMYYCRVLTGQYTRGLGGMRMPPPKQPGKPELFDSVVNNQANPDIFVIFNDTQAYPEYLIHFKV